jgi:hypothetical protein
MARLVAIICLVFASGAQAQRVVVNDNMELHYYGNIPNTATFRISKYYVFTPPGCGTCITDVDFRFADGVLSPGAISLDEESDWYLVHAGDSFSSASIAGGSFPVLIDLSVSPGVNGGPITLGTADFYLGIRTGAGYHDTPPYSPNRNVYGWVHLQSIGDTLTMLGNALSYDSSGIIVGTTTVVPEPTTATLLLLGMLGCGRRRRR